MQKLSANAAIGFHSYLHLHQSVLLILSCGVNLISSSQLFSSWYKFCSLIRFLFVRDDVKENDTFRKLNKIFHMIFKTSFQWKKWKYFSNKSFFIFSSLKSMSKHNIFKERWSSPLKPKQRHILQKKDSQAEDSLRQSVKDNQFLWKHNQSYFCC